MSAKKSATPKNLKQGSLFSFFSTKPKKPAAVAAASSKTTSKSSVPKLVTATRNTLTKTVTQTPSAKPTPSTEETRTPTNSVWKQVQVGYRLSVFWKDDRKYYPCTVTKVSQKTQFLLEYDDGETEQLDLSFEKFKILSTTKRRRIDDDDEDDEEHEWEDLEAESEEEDDGSVFEAPKEEEKDDEDEVDQWMVTDTEDNIPEEEDEAPPVKKRKTAKKTFKVTQHEAASIHTAASTTTSIKTPLRQFANTVSPSTASTHKSKQTPLMFSSSKDQRSASSPPAPRQLNPPTSKTNKPLDFVKGAVNPAGSHVHNHLNFLNYPRDKQGRAPTDPNYDPRTLKISSSEWERVYGGKMTNAVQQWWDLKSRYFDTVLLFKTGKFYEMFHMDADVGVNHCNLSYMKGHVAHAGYPEISCKFIKFRVNSKEYLSTHTLTFFFLTT
jgi:DNA mismatch repair protein MSH6